MIKFSSIATVIVKNISWKVYNILYTSLHVYATVMVKI